MRLSFCSSGDKASSSTSTNNLSKYCMSSGFITGRLPVSWWEWGDGGGEGEWWRGMMGVERGWY